MTNNNYNLIQDVKVDFSARYYAIYRARIRFPEDKEKIEKLETEFSENYVILRRLQGRWRKEWTSRCKYAHQTQLWGKVEMYNFDDDEEKKKKTRNGEGFVYEDIVITEEEDEDEAEHNALIKEWSRKIKVILKKIYIKHEKLTLLEAKKLVEEELGMSSHALPIKLDIYWFTHEMIKDGEIKGEISASSESSTITLLK